MTPPLPTACADSLHTAPASANESNTEALAIAYQQLQTQHQALSQELDLTKQALAQNYEQLQSIYYWAETTDSINQAATVEAIFAAASQGLQDVFNADLASFACCDGEGHLHWNDQAPASLASVFEGYNPWAESAAPYSPVAVTAVAELEGLAIPSSLAQQQAPLLEAGIEALLWLPIALGSPAHLSSSADASVSSASAPAFLLGYLGIYYCQPTPFDDALLALAQTMVNSMVLAVERKQAEDQLQQTLEELRQAQLQLVQNEKMSSLGQLVAGIAHEINNPVNFIHGNLAYLNDYSQGLLALVNLYVQQVPDASSEITELIEDLDLDFLVEDFPKTLSSMQVGTDRIREIVKSLRTFSRLDEESLKSVDLHEGIDSTLMILQHRLKATPQRAAIEVVKDYGTLPTVDCYSGPLNQVFMNILANAIDAIDGLPEGSLRQIGVRTTVGEGDWVEIAIADSGGGIPEAVKAKIFDPFFTTKPIGKGTGMGLSISYKIVTETHQGQLLCESKAGKGTTFTLRLPLGLTEGRV